MTELYDLTAAELHDGYRDGSLSPVEITKAVLARIDAWEPKINAMYLVHRESALQAAKESEARWRAHRPLSSLDGVPVTIKENVYTKGDPAPIGTAAGDMTPKPADAPPAGRTREAGCVIIGKTTMPDFGMLSSGLSTAHGITRNPWRLDRNTNGSSSGAGAAAAAGYGPLHIGTDIGGSVRLPATQCGIFALKPSLGRIPINPPFMGRVAGPMTRTVRDSALFLNILSRPDDRDHMNLPYDPVNYADGLDLDPNGLRIAYLPDMRCGLPPHPEVAAACKSAAAALSDAGAIVTEVTSFLTPEMLDGICRFFEARSYADVSVMSPAQREKILPFILEWCTWRAKDFSGRDVMVAYNLIQATREAAVKALAGFDFLISPVSPIPPYDAELPAPGNDPHNALPHIAFTVPWNFSEQPAASVPWTFTKDGLPIGVQVVGRRFDDRGVLRLSHTLEKLRQPLKPWPEPK
jgi:aspartyl-tRNA(Asn)/glutamyl-tRNA(Gln) amidotransferase subunit A